MRTATDLARIYALAQDDAAAGELFKSLAERTGLGLPALALICREFQANRILNVIYDALEGRSLPPPGASGGVSSRSIEGHVVLRAATRAF